MDIIRADIIMGALGPNAQIMSADQITSDKVGDNDSKCNQFLKIWIGGKVAF